MAVEALSPPMGQPPDPDEQMGLDLAAYQQRQRKILSIKIAVVWLVMSSFIMAFLLFIEFDFGYVLENAWYIIKEGAKWTIFISLVSIFFATILALFGALGRLSHNAIALGLSGFYVSLFRGTPLLIQIYVIYLGLPQVGKSLAVLGATLGLPFLSTVGDLFILSPIQSGVLALSLNYGAYMTEIFRAGIQSIHHGQNEAAISLGLTRWQTIRRVILPQAVRIIIPDIGNQFIAMQKDSSLVSIMGVWELTYMANRLARKEIKFMEMFLLAAAMYWLLTIISAWLEGLLEKRLSQAYER
jgi:polar amino acid transport system permease protein